MATPDPGFNQLLWWFLLGGMCGWLLFVVIDRLFWRDGRAAADRERTTIAGLEAELETRRAEQAELREALDTRIHESRRLTELTEQLRDRAAQHSQKVVNLEAALAAAREGAAAPLIGGVSAALVDSIARDRIPPRDIPATAAVPGEPARSEDGEPGFDEADDGEDRPARVPEQGSMFEPVTTIMRSPERGDNGLPDPDTDGRHEEAAASEPPAADAAPDRTIGETHPPLAQVDRPGDRSPAGAGTGTSEPPADPVQALREVLDYSDDTLDPISDPIGDDEDLFGAPTEILTAFHLHDEDDEEARSSDPDSDMMLDADTITLIDADQQGQPTRPRSGHARPTEVSEAHSTQAAGHPTDAFGHTRTMLDRVRGSKPGRGRPNPARSDTDEDMSLVSRLRGAFGRRKPSADR